MIPIGDLAPWVCSKLLGSLMVEQILKFQRHGIVIKVSEEIVI